MIILSFFAGFFREAHECECKWFKGVHYILATFIAIHSHLFCIILREPSFVLLSLLVDYKKLTNECNQLSIYDLYAIAVIVAVKESTKVDSVDVKLVIQTLYVTFNSLNMILFSQKLSEGVIYISYYVMGDCLYNVINIVILSKIKYFYK